MKKGDPLFTTSHYESREMTGCAQGAQERRVTDVQQTAAAEDEGDRLELGTMETTRAKGAGGQLGMVMDSERA